MAAMGPYGTWRAECHCHSHRQAHHINLGLQQMTMVFWCVATGWSWKLRGFLGANRVETESRDSWCIEEKSDRIFQHLEDIFINKHQLSLWITTFLRWVGQKPSSEGGGHFDPTQISQNPGGENSFFKSGAKKKTKPWGSLPSKPGIDKDESEALELYRLELVAGASLAVSPFRSSSRKLQLSWTVPVEFWWSRTCLEPSWWPFVGEIFGFQTFRSFAHVASLVSLW